MQGQYAVIVNSPRLTVSYSVAAAGSVTVGFIAEIVSGGVSVLPFCPAGKKANKNVRAHTNNVAEPKNTPRSKGVIVSFRTISAPYFCVLLFLVKSLKNQFFWLELRAFVF
jgi:hypothetical protein